MRKKSQIRRQLTRLQPGSVLLFEEETDLLWFPPLRAGWTLRGQPAPVVLSGSNDRRVIFGTLNMNSGTRLLLARPHQRGQDFQIFLEAISRHYRGWRIVLLWDRDSSHTAKSSPSLAAQLGIELMWLPRRSPELNPLELYGIMEKQRSVLIANMPRQNTRWSDSFITSIICPHKPRYARRAFCRTISG